MTDTMPATIEEAQAALATVQADAVANFERSSHGSSRTKTFTQRVNASLRRAVVLSEREKALERHIAKLQAAQNTPAPKVVTPEMIQGATLIRGPFGWEKVVKVNRTTVTVEAEPGWNNKVQFKKITDVR